MTYGEAVITLPYVREHWSRWFELLGADVLIGDLHQVMLTLQARVSDAAEFRRALTARHPGLREALPADARVTALLPRRAPRVPVPARRSACRSLRLAWVSDAFLAQALYRVKARLQALGVPVLPRARPPAGDGARAGLDRRPGASSHPGVYMLHGQVVVDGLVEIHPGVVDRARSSRSGCAPATSAAPTIERDVQHRHRREDDRPGARRRRGDDRRERGGASTTCRPARPSSGAPARPVR